MRLSADEVVAPDVIAALRTQTYARAVIQPETAARLLLLRNLKPLTAPDPLDAILADLPTRSLQQRRNAPITVAAILTSKLDDCLR